MRYTAFIVALTVDRGVERWAISLFSVSATERIVNAADEWPKGKEAVSSDCGWIYYSSMLYTNLNIIQIPADVGRSRVLGRKLRSADDVECFGLGLLAILTSLPRSLFLLLYDQRATIIATVQLLSEMSPDHRQHRFFPDGHVFCGLIFFLLNRSWG